MFFRRFSSEKYGREKIFPLIQRDKQRTILNRRRRGMDDVKKKKDSSTDMEDGHNHDHLFNLNRLKDGYGSIADKLGYGKFKPYLQRLFHSVETMMVQEITEFKKIDVKYQDIVRQCHIYEKTLSMLKENNYCELSSFNESSNTYALEDLTKVTPYLAPDLLQSTLGAGNAGSTSIQFRLPRQRSSLSSQHFVSTPLGPLRASKPTVPIAKFDEDPSFVLSNSLGFAKQQEKCFVDAGTDPEPDLVIETMDFCCQITPVYIDQEVETMPAILQYRSTQTETITTEHIACQIDADVNHCSIQTEITEQTEFGCQCMPTSIEQSTETIAVVSQTQTSQTDVLLTADCSSQITVDSVDQSMETNPILTHEIASGTSLAFDDQFIQTDGITLMDAFTQYELDTPDTVLLLPIVLSEELPVSNEIEISIHQVSVDDLSSELAKKIVFEQECQTMSTYFLQTDDYTQTAQVTSNDCACQSSATIYDDQHVQTEPLTSLYSSSLYIVPNCHDECNCSSTLVIMPQENPIPSRTLVDEQTQCDLNESLVNIPIQVEPKTTTVNDKRTLIQQQLDEKEKQMNRIIEEYASLYGEYEGERRRNMDLTEARDRLADHIKILSDELGDREINQEILLIKSCQQNKLINYMLPQIDCSPMPKKKHHSATSFRRLLPKFK